MASRDKGRKLSTTEAADLIGVNVPRVRQLAIAGTLKGLKVETGRGPLWMFWECDVKTYLTKRPNKWSRLDATKAPAKRKVQQ